MRLSSAGELRLRDDRRDVFPADLLRGALPAAQEEPIPDRRGDRRDGARARRGRQGRHRQDHRHPRPGADLVLY